MDLSEKITALRTSKGITQTFIAECLNMDRGNYSRLEKRGEKMTVEQLIGIAKALGVSLTELIGDEPIKANHDLAKIKELESQIKILQDRLKDKDFKLKSIERERVILETLLFSSFSDGLNHSNEVADYEEFIKKYPWIIPILSGIAFSGIKIKVPTWSIWYRTLNKLIKDVSSGEFKGDLLFGEASFSLTSEPPKNWTIDEYLEWVNDPANDVESISFYKYIADSDMESQE